MGKKNCEFSEEDIARICDTFLVFKETEQSKIFPNQAFGYKKVTVERPLRLRVDLNEESLSRFRTACEDAKETPLANLIDQIADEAKDTTFTDYNLLLTYVRGLAVKRGVKLTAKRLKLLQSVLAVHDENAEPVVKKIHKTGKAEVDPIQRALRGYARWQGSNRRVRA